MKLFLSLIPFFLFSSIYARQEQGPTRLQKLQSDLTEAAVEVSLNNSFGPKVYDTIYKDYYKTFYVSKSIMRDRGKMDSLFGLARYYLVDAIKGKYTRIVIVITTGKGLFARFREQGFRCDWLYEHLTGKKLY